MISVDKITLPWPRDRPHTNRALQYAPASNSLKPLRHSEYRDYEIVQCLQKMFQQRRNRIWPRPFHEEVFAAENVRAWSFFCRLAIHAPPLSLSPWKLSRHDGRSFQIIAQPSWRLWIFLSYQ